MNQNVEFSVVWTDGICDDAMCLSTKPVFETCGHLECRRLKITFTGLEQEDTNAAENEQVKLSGYCLALLLYSRQRRVSPSVNAISRSFVPMDVCAAGWY